MATVATRMTDKEFLDLAPEDRKVELLDGEMLMASPASTPHEELFAFLFEILRLYVREKDLGRVLGSRTAMRLSESDVYEPDIVFVSTAHENRIQRTFIDGPADLVVEILSRSTAYFDRGRKLMQCALAGVHEYWLLDPDQRIAEFYRLSEGRYARVPVADDDLYHSEAAPGFWLRIEWLWTQPKPLTIARELGLI
ncbi:MAG TPA: Uma2 family endonuclease [Anaerolineae bacterium]|nr:Uma2 family endonuclease [Anaerolineae bacterium]